MQIGFVGLGKMGGNMVARIRRDSDHEVIAFDFDSRGRHESDRDRGATGASSLEDLVSKLHAPRVVWIMVPAGDATQSTVDQLAKLLEPRRHDRRRGQLQVDRRQATGRSVERRELHYVDVGTSGGVWGLEVGYVHDGRRPFRRGQAPRSDPRCACPRNRAGQRGGDWRPRLAALRLKRRGALRENGPQRHRIRPDAGVCRGLRAVSSI